jgi:hypothetical protein
MHLTFLRTPKELSAAVFQGRWLHSKDLPVLTGKHRRGYDLGVVLAKAVHFTGFLLPPGHDADSLFCGIRMPAHKQDPAGASGP